MTKHELNLEIAWAMNTFYCNTFGNGCGEEWTKEQLQDTAARWQSILSEITILMVDIFEFMKCFGLMHVQIIIRE